MFKKKKNETEITIILKDYKHECKSACEVYACVCSVWLI